MLAMAYAMAAQGDKAREIIAELETESYLSPQVMGYIARAHLYLDEKEKSYQILEAQFSETGGLPYLTVQTSFEVLHTEARFIRLVNDSGLLKYNPATETFELN